jgi:hypothetical protein
MMRDKRLAQVKFVNQVADTRLTDQQELQDRRSRRIAQRLEEWRQAREAALALT